MRTVIKFHLKKLIQNNLLWLFLKPFASLGARVIEVRRLIVKKKKVSSNLADFPASLNSFIVLRGPFQGMEYPKRGMVGKSLYPKFIGSYELEIQPVIEEFSRNDYSEIINVGSAEGYYAIGMALVCKEAIVYAFDIDQESRQLCAEIAEINGVKNRIIIKKEFTPELLKSFPFSGKGLIICDCEGYEKTLFNEENIFNLKNCDLIIETHDFIDIGISTYLKKLLKYTHSINSVYSVDDIQKALHYKYPEIENFNLNKKRRILREGRPAVMEWLICRPSSVIKKS